MPPTATRDLVGASKVRRPITVDLSPRSRRNPTASQLFSPRQRPSKRRAGTGGAGPTPVHHRRHWCIRFLRPEAATFNLCVCRVLHTSERGRHLILHGANPAHHRAGTDVRSEVHTRGVPVTRPGPGKDARCRRDIAAGWKTLPHTHRRLDAVGRRAVARRWSTWITHLGLPANIAAVIFNCHRSRCLDRQAGRSLRSADILDDFAHKPPCAASIRPSSVRKPDGPRGNNPLDRALHRAGARFRSGPCIEDPLGMPGKRIRTRYHFVFGFKLSAGLSTLRTTVPFPLPGGHWPDGCFSTMTTSPTGACGT